MTSPNGWQIISSHICSSHSNLTHTTRHNHFVTCNTTYTARHTHLATHCSPRSLRHSHIATHNPSWSPRHLLFATHYSSHTTRHALLDSWPHGQLVTVISSRPTRLASPRHTQLVTLHLVTRYSSRFTYSSHSSRHTQVVNIKHIK